MESQKARAVLIKLSIVLKQQPATADEESHCWLESIIIKSNHCRRRRRRRRRRGLRRLAKVDSSSYCSLHYFTRTQIRALPPLQEAAASGARKLGRRRLASRSPSRSVEGLSERLFR